MSEKKDWEVLLDRIKGKTKDVEVEQDFMPSEASEVLTPIPAPQLEVSPHPPSLDEMTPEQQKLFADEMGLDLDVIRAQHKGVEYDELARLSKVETETYVPYVDHKQGYSPAKRHAKYEKSKKLMDLRGERRRQKSMDEFLFGDKTFLDYACDKVVSRKVFETKSTRKPRWAVRALVLLRDQGQCRVCGEEYGGRGVVVKLQPSVVGGIYAETNCVGICPNCEKVWSHNKNFYTTIYPQVDMLKQFLWVLKRRALGKKDVIPLGQVGLQTYRDTLHKLETLEARAAVEKEHNLKDIVGDALTESEIMELFKQFGAKKPKHLEVSENDKSRSEESSPPSERSE
jgi:hypothetical protein